MSDPEGEEQRVWPIPPHEPSEPRTRPFAVGVGYGDRCLGLRLRLRWWAGLRFEFDRNDPRRSRNVNGHIGSAGDDQPSSGVDHIDVNNVDVNHVDDDP